MTIKLYLENHAHPLPFEKMKSIMISIYNTHSSYNLEHHITTPDKIFSYLSSSSNELFNAFAFSNIRGTTYIYLYISTKLTLQRVTLKSTKDTKFVVSQVMESKRLSVISYSTTRYITIFFLLMLLFVRFLLCRLRLEKLLMLFEKHFFIYKAEMIFPLIVYVSVLEKGCFKNRGN